MSVSIARTLKLLSSEGVTGVSVLCLAVCFGALKSVLLDGVCIKMRLSLERDGRCCFGCDLEESTSVLLKGPLWCLLCCGDGDAD